jgi:hypothetical protein
MTVVACEEDVGISGSSACGVRACGLAYGVGC